jgi:hypothetical protein
MADGVQLASGDAGPYMLADHVQYIGRQSPGDAHPLLFLRRLDAYVHGAEIAASRKGLETAGHAA